MVQTAPEITFYHNPRCSKSRQALKLLRERDVEPTVVDYLKNPLNTRALSRILKLLDKEPRELMRKQESVYKQLGLDDPKLSRAALIRAMTQYPILMERPIVVAGDKAAVGRPPENVLKVL